MSVHSSAARPQAARPEWFKALSEYTQPDLRKTIWQLLNTFVPYVGLWALMVYIIRSGSPYWMALALTPLAAGLHVRIFIFFHDCGHGSFFASQRANRIVGTICGILTFTPYQDWRRAHATHHATAGDLDRRGTGDVWMMTTEEYRTASRSKQLAYRFVRHPAIMFGIGPTLIFLIHHRFAHRGPTRRELYSVILTDLAVVAILIVAGLTMGFGTYALIQLPILVISGAAGVWLFYVQHQYKGVYWARHDAWNRIQASLEGSSYYRLPKVLQWFTGNIGLHHIHHLQPRIPNYSLQRCYDRVPAVQAVKALTIRQSLKSLFLHLWDEEQKELVGFGSLAM